MNKLKQCPFCGGHVTIENIDDNGDNFFMVQCEDCGASACFGDKSETKDGAIKAWNMRCDK